MTEHRFAFTLLGAATGCAMLLAGCADDPAPIGDGPPVSTTACPDGGISGDGLCVFSGAITETGFQCPPELPFEYQGDGWALCSSDDGLDEQAIDDALEEAGVEQDDPEAQDDPPCTDFDGDGVCAQDDLDDRDPNIGAAEVEDPNDPNDPPDGCILDLDGDGSCNGMDFDDNDPLVRDIGLRYGHTMPNAGEPWLPLTGGQVDLVNCAFPQNVWDAIGDFSGLTDDIMLDYCQGLDVCLLDYAGVEDLEQSPVWMNAVAGCDPDRGFLTSTDQLDFAEPRCVYDNNVGAPTEICWYSWDVCRDESGDPTACTTAEGPGDDPPCRDDNRDGLCDDTGEPVQ